LLPGPGGGGNLFSNSGTLDHKLAIFRQHYLLARA
jgi:hypothetical protein